MIFVTLLTGKTTFINAYVQWNQNGISLKVCTSQIKAYNISYVEMQLQ